MPPWLPSDPQGAAVPLAALLLQVGSSFWKVAAVARPTVLAGALVVLAVRMARDGVRPHAHGGLRWLLAAALAYAGPWMMMQAASAVAALEVRENVAQTRFLVTATFYTASPSIFHPVLADEDLARAVNALPEEKREQVRAGLRQYAEAALGWGKSLWRSLKDFGSALGDDPLGLAGALFSKLRMEPLAFVLDVIVYLARIGHLAFVTFLSNLLDAGVVLCVLLLGPVLLPLLAWERTHEWGVRPISVFLYVCALKLAFIGHLELLRYAHAYFLYAQSVHAAAQLGRPCPGPFTSVEKTLEALRPAAASAENEYRLAEEIYRFQVCLAEQHIEVLKEAPDRTAAERLALALAQRRNRSYAAHLTQAALLMLVSLMLGAALPRLVRLVLPQEILHGVAVRALGGLVGAAHGAWDRLTGTAVGIAGFGGAAAGGAAGAVVGGAVGAVVGGPAGALIGGAVGAGAGAKMMGGAAKAVGSGFGALPTGSALAPKDEDIQ